MRKTAELREKELRLAISRIKRGRSITQAKSLSIASVAREVGISTALIHNRYPTIAEEIRAEIGRSSRQQRDAKAEQLKVERDKNKVLREEIRILQMQIRQLASINEGLHHQNEVMSAALINRKVVSMNFRK